MKVLLIILLLSMSAIHAMSQEEAVEVIKKQANSEMLADIQAQDTLSGKIDAINKYFNKIKTTKKYPDGITPLMWACCENQISLAGALLTLGADPNIKDSHNETALYKVAIYGYAEIVSMLLEKKVKIDIYDTSPLGDITNPLLGAISYGQPNAARLLFEAGADKEVKNHRGGRSLLQIAQGNVDWYNTEIGSDRAERAQETLRLVEKYCGKKDEI